MPDPLGSFDYTWPYYAAAVIGYLLGSIPFGLLLTRAAGHGDIRQIGSGNIGTMNVLRTGNKWLALATVLLDGGKGAVAVLAAGYFGPDFQVLAGGGALLGHCFPVWLRFRGGKAVATALGVLLAMAPLVALLVALAWIVTAVLFRIGSLSSLVAAALAPVYAYLLADIAIGTWFLSSLQIAEFCVFMAVLIWVMHYANIRRLIQGKEPRIGQRTKAENNGPG